MQLNRLLEANITITIFLVAFMQLVYKKFGVLNTENIPLSISIIVGIYLATYGFLQLIPKSNDPRPPSEKTVRAILIVNIFCAAFVLLFLPGVKELSGWPVIIQYTIASLLPVLFYLIFLILPVGALIGVIYMFVTQDSIKMLKERIKPTIRQEKNIRIRERHEAETRRLAAIILALLIGGNFAGSAFNLYSWAVASSLVVLLLCLFFFLNGIYLRKYTEYTNELIRQEE